MLDAWFHLKKLDVCVCVPAKCGGTSFYIQAFGLEHVDIRHVHSAAVEVASMTGQGPYTPIQIAEYFSDKHKYLGIKDPMARFISLWRDKCRDGDKNMLMLKGWDWATLLEYIAQYPVGNAHWTPQHLYRVPGCQIIESTSILSVLGLADLRVNKTEPKSSDPEIPITEVVRLYQYDFELWRRIHANDS